MTRARLPNVLHKTDNNSFAQVSYNQVFCGAFSFEHFETEGNNFALKVSLDKNTDPPSESSCLPALDVVCGLVHTDIPCSFLETYDHDPGPLSSCTASESAFLRAPGVWLAHKNLRRSPPVFTQQLFQWL